MNRKLRIAAVIMLICFVCPVISGCGLFGRNEPSSPIDIPTAEPTGVPGMLDKAAIEGFVGDWYGIFNVAEARGIYARNSKVRNDCAMRVAIDDYGRGSCYMQVNGMGRDSVSGSSNVFALCTAQVSGSKLNIEGMINRQPVEWSFELENGRLSLTEVYGDVNDHMRIEIVLLRPDSFAGSGIMPDAMDYMIEHGCADVIDRLGGSTAELPAINVPEGVDPHVFFTGDGSTSPAINTPAPTEEAGTVLSTDGHFRIKLPEGYELLSNTVLDLSAACPQKGILCVNFAFSSWGTDSLSFLMANTPNVTELYHYTISGYDFYGTFLPAVTEDPMATPFGSTVFKLCGTNGTGNLVIITVTTAMDAYSAYNYVNVDNADFCGLILGAEIFD